MTAIRAQVVCADCGRVFLGTLLTWPFEQDPAERWRIPWHKRPAEHLTARPVCRGYWKVEHRRYDGHRQAS